MFTDGAPAPEQVLSAEEWNEQRREIYSVMQGIYTELKRIYGDSKFFDQLAPQIQDPIHRRTETAGVSAKEASKYVAWHVISGGGTDQKYSPFVDFNGDLSIRKFLEDKLEELKGMG